MRALLSTIGSRGDVQPLVALAFELRAGGQDVLLCVPPDFRDWIAKLGMPVTAIGPEIRSNTNSSGAAAPLTTGRWRQMMEVAVASQFEAITAAARGCDLIVCAGAPDLQIAAPSVAEKMGIPYVFAAYSPAVLPSPSHAPPLLAMLGDVPLPPATDYRDAWARNARRWNETWGPLVNSQRIARGLSSIYDVRRYVLTDRPWLASDQTLAPWPDPADGTIVRTGTWVLPDERPLSRELQAFLDAGEAPVYFGFGSFHVPKNFGRVVIESARALGRRAIVSRGWADLSLEDNGSDCFAVDEVNLNALFKRVVAAVHHGGAGTMTAAARAGAPQVVVPQHYDNHYWALRVQHLGIGVAHATGTPTTESLRTAVERVLEPAVAARARAISGAVGSDGARVAARRLISDARVG